MTIDRISSTEPIAPGKKTGQSSRVNPAGKTDSIALSPEAKEMSELYRAVELVSSASDIRSNRVAELKAKINDPAYINDTILNATADKLLAAFGL